MSHIAAIEKNVSTSFFSLLEKINAERKDNWGIARINKRYLRPMTNEGFMSAIRPALNDAEMAHIYFWEDNVILITWQGNQKRIFRQIAVFIHATFVDSGITVDPTAVTTYINPITDLHAIKESLTIKPDPNMYGIPEPAPSATFTMFDIDEEDEDDTLSHNSLSATEVQRKHFKEVASTRMQRKQLHILVVEDSPFHQKLLCDILRGIRLSNSHDVAEVNASVLRGGIRVTNNSDAPNVAISGYRREAWEVYLKTAPDIIFIDLHLTDGSGHPLAQAVKEIDPKSYVIVVTANNYSEEIDVANQNNVDAFIPKPYNKQTILDCVAKYATAFRTTRGYIK